MPAELRALHRLFDARLGLRLGVPRRRLHRGVEQRRQQFLTKQNGIHSQWLQTPNGINQSVIGIKMSRAARLWGGWIIGTGEMGFNPYWGYLADAQRAQVQNNGKALTLQTANADSSRSGQWDNSQAFIGLSNPTYGTLTVGRVNTLSLDGNHRLRSAGGAYAFTPLTFSGSYGGFGDTEPSEPTRGSSIE